MTKAHPRRSGRLEALVPGLSAKAPRLALADLPTPIEAAEGLAARFGLAGLYVKRDDRTSRLYGGSKVRGLEFFLGRAALEGSRAVVTLGSAGSNHVIATATFAREVGILSRCVLFPFPDRAYADLNVSRLVGLGADVKRAGWLGVIPALLQARSAMGSARPLWIPPGGSGALGVLGAAEGALEVVAQCREGRLAMPEVVVVAAGSCGTAAGLVLGFALAGISMPVVAVRVVPRVVASRRKIMKLARAGLEALRAAGFAAPVDFGGIEVIHSEVGPGYGRPTAAATDAVAVVRGAGLPAETTYTGKTWAHLVSGGFRGRRVLFWNTYGG